MNFGQLINDAAPWLLGIGGLLGLVLGLSVLYLRRHPDQTPSKILTHQD